MKIGMKEAFGRTAAIVVLFLGVTGNPARAMGRRPDYQDSPNYAPNRVQRGSAANPNAAFSPPQWDNQPAAPSSSPAPVTTRLTQPKLSPNASPDNLPALQDNGAPTGGAVPLRTTPLPPPKAAPSPQDSSEAPLPDYPTDDNTGKAAADLLNNASNPTTHPPAQ